MNYGGKRDNLGRPVGYGKYGEITTVLRVPVSRMQEIKRGFRRGYFV